MEYKIVEESPVSRKIDITVSPNEVETAIAGAIALNKDSVQIDGYRKGKVPPAVIEKRFHDSIYNEARENLLNVHINEILQKLEVSPVGPLVLKGDDKPLEKGKEYNYTIEFEIMPKLDLPNYEGLEVTEEKTVQDEEELKKVFERLLSEHATLVPVEGKEPAKDGQIAVIDFEAFENGKAIKEFRAENFDLEVGKNQALPDFEKIVKGIPVGNTGEGNVHFPDDFFVPELANKDLAMKVTVHAVKEKKIPELTDDFAKQIGFNSAESLKELITKSYLHTLNKVNKGTAQQKLLEQLLKQVDIPLPPKMVDTQADILLGDRAHKLEMQGKSLKSLGKSGKELLEMIKPEAEQFAKRNILLLTIAKKENLEVTPDELKSEIMRASIRNGENFQENLRKLEESGMILHVRDQLLCDKAMDLIYAKAKVQLVDPTPENKTGEDTNKQDAKKEE